MKTLDNSPKYKYTSVSAVFVTLNGSDMDELLPKVTLAEARHHVATEGLELQRCQNKLARMFISNLAKHSSHRSPHSAHKGSDRHQYAPKQLNM